MTTENFVRAGTGVFLVRPRNENNKQKLTIWLGKRKNAHGAGEWALPGGKPELYENVDDAAKREVLEETGCVVQEIVKLTWSNDIYRDHSLHYVTLYYVATKWTGTPTVMEPEKCGGWQEFDVNDLPEPIMSGLKNAVEVLKLQYNVLLD